MAFAETLASTGVPIVAAATPEEEARILLEAAAEIEHALLVEYLYAAFSVTSGTLRSECLEIAVQEMAHLVTVQNLLMFIGATPHFERQDSSPNPELDPFPFTLAGFAVASAGRKDALERFILAEMPATPPAGEEALIAEMQARLDPGRKFRRVGVVYARIYWLLQSSGSPEGPWPEVTEFARLSGLKNWHIASFPGAATADTFQAADAEGIWEQNSTTGVFRTIRSRLDALTAVHDIAVEGEGLTGSGPKSHFARFLQQLKNGLPATGLISVADNPSLTLLPNHSQVTDLQAVALCSLFDNRYRILIAALAAALRYSRAVPVENQTRQSRVEWAFFEMRRLGALARLITNRPCVAGGTVGSLAAGPPFDLGPSALPTGLAQLEQRLQDIHQETAAIITNLRDLGVTDRVLERIENENRERYP